MLKPLNCAVLTASALLFGASSLAQCNINFDFGDEPFGVSPDPTVGEDFNAGILEEDYFDVLHILIPATAEGIDDTYPPELAVDSVIVIADAINGDAYTGIVFTDTATMEEFHAADIGLEVVLNNDNVSVNESTFLGGGQYCAAIQGVPTRAGVYRIAIGIEAWATLGIPFSVPYVFDNFLLRVNCPLVDSVGVVNYNSVTGEAGQLSVTLSEGVESEDITWYNDLGGVVGTGDSISVTQSGLYTLLVNTDNCSSEVAGILVEDDGLDGCSLEATVDVVPASEGMADGEATVSYSGESGEVQVSWYDEFGFLIGTEPFVEYLLSGVYRVVVSDALGCTVEINDVDATTGVSFPEAPNWKMFPNPATDLVSLRGLPQNATWSVLTLDGRILNQGRGAASITIDVSSLSSGMYLVRVVSNSNTATQKPLVLQRK